jgi:uncharacterized protein (TIGR00645 family)
MDSNGWKGRVGHVVVNLERRFEWFIFWTRWILAPAYIVLCACIAVLVWKTFEEFLELVLNLHAFAQTKAIAQVLIIVDLVLVINLILMVVFVGYNTFVSKIKAELIKEEDAPRWMDELDYSGLKIQVLGSIIAVSAINILRLMVELTDLGEVQGPKFLWLMVFHVTFLLSALVVAIVNRMKPVHSRA